jgi:hypothetical protein
MLSLCQGPTVNVKLLAEVVDLKPEQVDLDA